MSLTSEHFPGVIPGFHIGNLLKINKRSRFGVSTSTYKRRCPCLSYQDSLVLRGDSLSQEARHLIENQWRSELEMNGTNPRHGPWSPFWDRDER